MNLEKRCQEIRLGLYPFLKGELDSEANALIQQHLDVCNSCEQEMRQMREVLDDLSACHNFLEPPEGGWDRLASRIEIHHRTSSKRWRREYKIAACVIGLLGTFCLLYLLKINDQVLRALRETLGGLGLDWPWLFEGPLSSFLAPLLFIALCSLMTLVLSPILLKKKRAAREKAAAVEERKVLG